MGGKHALIIGNTEYADPGLARLTSPGKDAEDLARVLRDKNICAFDEVRVLLNQPAAVISETIDEFFYQKKPEDLLVLYFSGHGVRDEFGALYLAAQNTNRFLLRSTAIKSAYISEIMDQSRSKRQVLILDCCNSGAFAQGTKAATGASIGTAAAFEGTGYGRVVLTASDSTQFAWQGDAIVGEMENSLFTHFLVKGIEGAADQNGDGRITIDELYDYAYGEILSLTPKQTPGKWSYKQQGEIVLRQNIRMEDVQPVPLPPEIIHAMESPLSHVRAGVVEELAKLLRGKNIRLAHSAKEALERMEREDDSRRVSQAAARALEAHRQPVNQQAPAAPEAEAKTTVWEDTAAAPAPPRAGATAAPTGRTVIAATGEAAPERGRRRPASAAWIRLVALGALTVTLIVCVFATAALLRTMLAGPAAPPPTASETAVETRQPESTRTSRPESTRTSRPESTSTPRPTSLPGQTATVDAAATARYADFYAQIQDYRGRGYLSSLEGVYVVLHDYSESVAKLNWIGGHTIAYDRSLSDFVFTAHFAWSTAVQTADESGCGIWFAIQDNGDSYFVFLDKSRIYFLRYDASQGRYTREVGKSRGTGQVAFGNPAEADFALIVNDHQAYVHVGDQFIGEYNLPANSITAGRLGYTVLSGTNKDYGTRCDISDARLWIVEK